MSRVIRRAVVWDELNEIADASKSASAVMNRFTASWIDDSRVDRATSLPSAVLRFA